MHAMPCCAGGVLCLLCHAVQEGCGDDPDAAPSLEELSRDLELVSAVALGCARGLDEARRPPSLVWAWRGHLLTGTSLTGTSSRGRRTTRGSPSTPRARRGPSSEASPCASGRAPRAGAAASRRKGCRLPLRGPLPAPSARLASLAPPSAHLPHSIA